MLEVGSKAKEFKLLNDNNEEVSLSSLLKLNKKIILYFYPKDNTSGCSLEALNYKDNYDTLVNNYNVIVIGVSKDSIKSHINFKSKYNLPFTLLSDESTNMLVDYDVYKEKSMYGKKYMGIVRTTYLINEEGIIIYANDKVKAKEDALNMIKILDSLIK